MDVLYENDNQKEDYSKRRQSEAVSEFNRTLTEDQIKKLDALEM